MRLRQETEGPQEEYGLTPDRVSSNLDTVKGRRTGVALPRLLAPDRLQL